MSQVLDDLKYTKDHEWIRMEDEFIGACGITDHAQEMLTDIVFVELPQVGTEISKGEQVMVVESVKAVSDVYAPVSGRIVEVNGSLEEAPELINSDPYGEGWIFKVEVKNPSELEDLMDPLSYGEFVAAEE